jgi:hypothetical protein
MHRLQLIELATSSTALQIAQLEIKLSHLGQEAPLLFLKWPFIQVSHVKFAGLHVRQSVMN